MSPCVRLQASLQAACWHWDETVALQLSGVLSLHLSQPEATRPHPPLPPPALLFCPQDSDQEHSVHCPSFHWS